MSASRAPTRSDAHPANPHVIAFDWEPARAWVRDPDPWSVGPSRADVCGKVGAAIYDYGRGVQHFPRRCDQFTCSTCAVLRCHLIRRDLTKHWVEPDEPVWLYRVDAASADEVGRRVTTITDAIRHRGGRFIWIGSSFGHQPQAHVFASVDFSTVRANRGIPPRRCHEMSAPAAYLYAFELLRHGIVARGCSRGAGGWPLRDGARSRRAHAADPNRVFLHDLGPWKADRIEPKARRIYAVRSGPGAPTWDQQKHPPGMSMAEAAALMREATANVVAGTETPECP